MEERRTHPRVEAAVTVDITFRGEEMICFSADLSLGGTQIMNPPADLAAGDKITMAVHVGEEERIEIVGRVAWISDLETGSSCGVEFVDLSESAEAELKTLIEQYDSLD